jgi:hypothetical protein
MPREDSRQTRAEDLSRLGESSLGTQLEAFASSVADLAFASRLDSFTRCWRTRGAPVFGAPSGGG